MKTGIVPAVAVNPIGEAALDLFDAAVRAARAAARKKRLRAARAAQRGWQLRPGRETPLWNELMRRVGGRMRRHGDQAHLARLLGLPRQRLNRCLTGKAAMLDAERTLLLVGWLVAQSEGREIGTPPAGIL